MPAPESPLRHNFVLLVIYQVALRVGWIFKTESIVMPAVLDSLGGGAWLRGCLPLLNRFGQSIPPLLVSRHVKVMPRKKWGSFATTLVMSSAFLALSAIWFWADGQKLPWMAMAFLILYGIFFVGTGINQLCFNTLQGKLIPTNKRGRLLLVTTVCGAITAIGFAWWLFPKWLSESGGQFQFIFGFSGICFFVAAMISLGLNESADDFQEPRRNPRQLWQDSLDVLRRDRNFRRLSFVGAAFATSLMLFPHYQAIGFQRLELSFSLIVWWVIIQNAGAAGFSFVIGPLADSRGNRAVLQFVLLCIVAAPLLAIGLSHYPAVGRVMYPCVFLLVGLTPVVVKVFCNYTLEVAKRADHPRYLSTLMLCIAAPVLLSPIVGLLVGWIGFDAVFIVIALVVLYAWFCTFGLEEPRHHTAGALADPIVDV